MIFGKRAIRCLTLISNSPYIFMGKDCLEVDSAQKKTSGTNDLRCRVSNLKRNN